MGKRSLSICRYKVFIKYCGFFNIPDSGLSLFSLGVSVCTHTRKVEHQRCNRNGIVQKNHEISRKNTISNKHPVFPLPSRVQRTGERLELLFFNCRLPIRRGRLRQVSPCLIRKWELRQCYLVSLGDGGMQHQCLFHSGRRGGLRQCYLVLLEKGGGLRQSYMFN